MAFFVPAVPQKLAATVDTFLAKPTIRSAPEKEYYLDQRFA